MTGERAVRPKVASRISEVRNSSFMNGPSVASLSFIEKDDIVTVS